MRECQCGYNTSDVVEVSDINDPCCPRCGGQLYPTICQIKERKKKITKLEYEFVSSLENNELLLNVIAPFVKGLEYGAEVKLVLEAKQK